MKLIYIFTLSFIIYGCAGVNRKPSHYHEAHDHQEIENSFHEAEVSPEFFKETELPDDPAFIDKNGNGLIDPEEISTENISPALVANPAFAKKPILSLGLQKGELILTIDDGPQSYLTPKILDLLKDYNIQATFFVTGSRVAAHADIIKRMYREGHTIGNHTFSHNVKGITSSTIGREILKAHDAIVKALEETPKGRLLFRAPGLAWSTPKATNLNAGKDTRFFIGPIHANLGTDAPHADWHCWSKRRSSETCANYYFDLIARKGRGIVLAHDIALRKGVGNTYEMLEILLKRLDRNGGIKNIRANGFWNFVRLDNRSALDKLDVGMIGDAAISTGPSSPFTKLNVNVRNSIVKNLKTSEDLETSEDSKVKLRNNETLKTGNILKYEKLNDLHTAGKYELQQIRIIEMMPGYELPADKDVYVWTKAF